MQDSHASCTPRSSYLRHSCPPGALPFDGEDHGICIATDRADLDTLHATFVALAKAIPADKYDWRPAAGVRSIGEAFMHAASEYYTYAPASWNAKRSPVVTPGREGYAAFEKKSTKADVLEHLDAGWDYTKSTVSAADPSSLTGKVKIFGGQYTITETSLGVVGDLHEHLGQLIAYARMNGIVPPWSK